MFTQFRLISHSRKHTHTLLLFIPLQAEVNITLNESKRLFFFFLSLSVSLFVVVVFFLWGQANNPLHKAKKEQIFVGLKPWEMWLYWKLKYRSLIISHSNVFNEFWGKGILFCFAFCKWRLAYPTNSKKQIYFNAKDFFLIYHSLMSFLMHSKPSLHLKYYIKLNTNSFVQPQPGRAQIGGSSLQEYSSVVSISRENCSNHWQKPEW